MSKKNKMMASILVMSMVLANVTSIAADAATIPDVESNFEYELVVEAVSDTQLTLTLFTTCNPGIYELGLAFVFDAAKYECVDFSYDVDQQLLTDGQFIAIPAINNKEGVCVIGCALDENVLTGEREDYNGKLAFSFDFNIIPVDENEDDENDNNENNQSAFSAAVVDYASNTEEVKMETRLDPIDGYVPEEEPPELNVTVTPEQSFVYEYMLGDTDGNSSLTISDATNINSIVASAQACNVSNMVDVVNFLIENNSTFEIGANNTIVWGSRFDYLIKTENDVTFPCAEIADANQDGYITTDDSNIVLGWYSEIGVGTSPEQILQYADKTVYY
jgi:hypothetical protein